MSYCVRCFNCKGCQNTDVTQVMLGTLTRKGSINGLTESLLSDYTEDVESFGESRIRDPSCLSFSAEVKIFNI